MFKVGRADVNKLSMSSAVCDTGQQRCNVDVVAELTDHVVGAALVQPKFCYDVLRCLEPHEKLQYGVYRHLMGCSLVGNVHLQYIRCCSFTDSDSNFECV